MSGVRNKPSDTCLFGPVPSRRLGLSLGVDLVLPKTCSLDCVYCESGRTTVLTAERTGAVSAERVIGELSSFLSRNPSPDYITFSGCGEPTLNPAIRTVTEYLKRHHPRYPVALLTNSTLFPDAEVRRDVRDVDLIVASLDAVSPGVFRRINRPAPGIEIGAVIEGLVALRREFSGLLWLEIFIVPGLNDTPGELDGLAAAARRIGADRIQLNSLDRPGSEAWVRAMAPEERQRIASRFSGFEIIGDAPEAGAAAAQDADTALEGRILAMIRRRPCTAEDLRVSLSASAQAVAECLDGLVRTERVTTESLDRGLFYRIA
ncbi:hypothetical protein JCM14469_15800 [Desulfatiferula olefinivorans]